LTNFAAHPKHSDQKQKVSTILGSVLPEQRKEGEWIEGVAIWVAVLIVIAVGEGLWVIPHWEGRWLITN